MAKKKKSTPSPEESAIITSTTTVSIQPIQAPTNNIVAANASPTPVTAHNNTTGPHPYIYDALTTAPESTALANTKKLFKRGHDVNAVSTCNMTPCFMAVNRGFVKVLRFLVHECNADITIVAALNGDAVTTMHTTVLHYAIMREDEAAVQVLAASDQVHKVINTRFGEHGMTPLGHAIAVKSKMIIQVLLERGARVGAHEVLMLHKACYDGDKELLKCVLSAVAECPDSRKNLVDYAKKCADQRDIDGNPNKNGLTQGDIAALAALAQSNLNADATRPPELPKPLPPSSSKAHFADLKPGFMLSGSRSVSKTNTKSDTAKTVPEVRNEICFGPDCNFVSNANSPPVKMCKNCKSRLSRIALACGLQDTASERRKVQAWLRDIEGQAHTENTKDKDQISRIVESLDASV